MFRFLSYGTFHAFSVRLNTKQFGSKLEGIFSENLKKLGMAALYSEKNNKTNIILVNFISHYL